MQNCLGIYIEDNLIKYAKVSKDKNEFKVEAFGTKFVENNNLNETIKTVVQETFSYNTPISINLANEKYLYFDIFALLSKKDIQKSVETEYQVYCDENSYNEKAFESRYALVPNIENKEKIKAIDVIVNKIELNRQKQYLDKYTVNSIAPIGTSIACIAKLDKKENAMIVNMEEKTTVTTIFDRQIYNVETLDFGSQEVLEKINMTENSLSKAYEICKTTTIYTANVLDSDKEQPYLEEILPTLYQIAQSIKQTLSESPLKISNIYLTGTLAGVNNVDLYFQELLPTVDCKILRPSILEEKVTQINIKDYIEVNSAIALAMQALGEGVQSLNFKKVSIIEKAGQLVKVRPKSKTEKAEKLEKQKIKINLSFKGNLEKTEIMLIRGIVIIILANIIFTVFSKMLSKQMDIKQQEIQGLIEAENSEISRIDSDTTSLQSKSDKYIEKTEQLKVMNDKISNVAEMKNSIPNLLNQIMFVIPESVQLISIENTTGKKVTMVAQASNYDQLGYFIAKVKLEGILKNVVSSSGQKSSNIVKVSIEGELP